MPALTLRALLRAPRVPSRQGTSCQMPPPWHGVGWGNWGTGAFAWWRCRERWARPPAACPTPPPAPLPAIILCLFRSRPGRRNAASPCAPSPGLPTAPTRHALPPHTAKRHPPHATVLPKRSTAAIPAGRRPRRGAPSRCPPWQAAPTRPPGATAAPGSLGRAAQRPLVPAPRAQAGWHRARPGQRGAGATPALGTPRHRPGTLPGVTPANHGSRPRRCPPRSRCSSTPSAERSGQRAPEEPRARPAWPPQPPPPFFPPCWAELLAILKKKNNKDMENSITSLSSSLDSAFANSKQTPEGGGGSQTEPDPRHGKPVFTKKKNPKPATPTSECSREGEKKV